MKIIKVTVPSLILFIAIAFGISSVKNVDLKSFYTQEDSSFSSLEKGFMDGLMLRNRLISLNGWVMSRLGVNSYYSTSYGIHVDDDGYCINYYPETSTDFELEQVVSFKEYLEDKGIRFFYASAPMKYIDDSYFADNFGGESYCNRNANLLLSRLQENGVDTLDFCDNIREQNLDCFSMFYKTDHHWTVPASKWAAIQLATKLNTDYGYNIDLSVYDDDRYNVVQYDDCWLGEQGQVISEHYGGLDSYTYLEPSFETSFSITNDETGEVENGDFNLFVDKSRFDTAIDVYDSQSWHYAFSGRTYEHIHNNNVTGGNVLLLSDSYGESLTAFLALGVENLTYIETRNVSGNIRNYIENEDYDIVILSYAQGIIGAHDEEGNANQYMFELN